MQRPDDVKYLKSAIRDGSATEIMDMVRQMDDVVHALEIEDSFESPVEAINKLRRDLGLPVVRRDSQNADAQ